MSICTTPMCSEGRASVRQMLQVFDSLSNNPAFDHAHYKETVNSIASAMESTLSVWSEFIPFNSDCCTAKQIGTEADSVTADMLASVGAAQPGPGPSGVPEQDWVGMAVLAAVVIGGVFLVKELGR